LCLYPQKRQELLALRKNLGSFPFVLAFSVVFFSFAYLRPVSCVPITASVLAFLFKNVVFLETQEHTKGTTHANYP
jgi:hypothetical protein